MTERERPRTLESQIHTVLVYTTKHSSSPGQNDSLQISTDYWLHLATASSLCTLTICYSTRTVLETWRLKGQQCYLSCGMTWQGKCFCGGRSRCLLLLYLASGADAGVAFFRTAKTIRLLRFFRLIRLMKAGSNPFVPAASFHSSGFKLRQARSRINDFVERVQFPGIFPFSFTLHTLPGPTFSTRHPHHPPHHLPHVVECSTGPKLH